MANDVLKNEEDYLLIDTRNWYETEMGKFKGAISPGIHEFGDFPQWLEDNNVPKDKKILRVQIRKKTVYKYVSKMDFEKGFYA